MFRFPLKKKMNAWGLLLAGAAGYALYSYKTAPDITTLAIAESSSREMEIAKKAVELRKTGVIVGLREDQYYQTVYPTQGNAHMTPITSGDVYLDAAALEVARDVYHAEMVDSAIVTPPITIASAIDARPVLVTTLGDGIHSGIDPNYIYQMDMGIRKKRGGTHQKY